MLKKIAIIGAVLTAVVTIGTIIYAIFLSADEALDAAATE